MNSLGSNPMSDQNQRRPQVSVRLGDELREAVERCARAERRSVSNCNAAIVAAAVEPERGAAA
jgi:predicted transcriptional regulator